jgi:hypothetical protein
MQVLHHYLRYAWIPMSVIFIITYALGGHAGAFLCAFIVLYVLEASLLNVSSIPRHLFTAQ